MEIPKEILEYYGMATLKEYTAEFLEQGEEMFYSKFLNSTDYIPNKIVEAKILGEDIEDDYIELLKYREFARQEINRIKSITP